MLKLKHKESNGIPPLKLGKTHFGYNGVRFEVAELNSQTKQHLNQITTVGHGRVVTLT